MDGWQSSQEREREEIDHLHQLRPVATIADMNCSLDLAITGPRDHNRQWKRHWVKEEVTENSPRVFSLAKKTSRWCLARKGGGLLPMNHDDVVWTIETEREENMAPTASSPQDKGWRMDFRWQRGSYRRAQQRQPQLQLGEIQNQRDGETRT
jgi:hypothetical protein